MNYFTIEELIYSDTAKKYKIDNTPTPEQRKNLEYLISYLLNPLREAWTAYCKAYNLGTGAIIITSGFRCKELNDKLNGAKNSSHLYGYAVDMIPTTNKMKEFQDFIQNWLITNKIEFDQLIIEKPKNGVASWLHLGIKNGNNEQRKQIFTLN